LFYEAAQRAFRKIRASLDSRTLAYLNKLAGRFHQTSIGSTNYADKAEIVDQLLIGIEDQRAMFVTYRSQQSTEPVTYDIYPYGMTQHRGALYLVGYAPRHEEMRQWKVSRIEDAEFTEVRFQRPADFELSRYFAGAFGVFRSETPPQTIDVVFSRDVARYVSESQWHASQQLTTLPNGRVQARFSLSNTTELKSWLLSFGRHAEVIAPESLRREMREEITAMSARYPGDEVRPQEPSQRRTPSRRLKNRP
jgi:predicted DNA-binding transcriptional regulator YafY